MNAGLGVIVLTGVILLLPQYNKIIFRCFVRGAIEISIILKKGFSHFLSLFMVASTTKLVKYA